MDTVSNVVIQRKAWRKDRFTNALPFAQRGNPVYLPLAQEAPVVGTGQALGIATGSSTIPNSGMIAGDGLTLSALCLASGVYGADVGTPRLWSRNEFG